MTNSQLFFLIAIVFVAPHVRPPINFILAAVALTVALLTKLMT